jgi:hypothetical protein
MKTRLFLSTALAFCLLPCSLHAAEKRAGLWKEVDAAAANGLPKTAIEKLAPITKAALAEKAWPEAIKAITRRISLEGEIEGQREEEKITRLQAELAKAPPEMAPVFEAILAQWYWNYFQQNRSAFLERTQTAEAPGPDFTTWDLPRLFAEIDVHFTKALAAEAELKKIPVADFDSLLAKGTVPDAWRPTLYDFLAHEALEFYASGEQAATKAENEFELPAEGPIFGPTEDFLKWAPAGDSVPAKGIRLFQALLRTHADDAEKSALLHCDLERLRFGKNHAVGDDKDTRYLAALKRFAEQWADHELSAVARSEWAKALQEQNPAEARAIAKQGADAFPEKIGGKLCRTVVQQIDAKSVKIETEHVWNAPWPGISVRYRNLTALHFRLVQLDWEAELRHAAKDNDLEKRLPGMKAVREWKADLPPTRDYRERLEILAAPEDLPLGFYALVASPAAGFGEKENVVSYATFWVSNLALVLRPHEGETLVDGFVLDARSGEPLAGARVEFIVPEAMWFNRRHTAHTDRNGHFAERLPNEKSALTLVTYKDQQLASADDIDISRDSDESKAATQTVFFTDRSIYRPGQGIQYKGICLRADEKKDNYKVLGGQAVTVEFLDVNGKEIAKATHKTNDYGSFSGSFTAPRDRLTGQMSIHVKKGPTGMTALSVEEYKRPKFIVTLDPPKAAAKLGEKVTVSGKAAAYTGAAVGGAKVRWRVVREVSFPAWWSTRFWWRKAPGGDSQEIAHGTSTTADDGAFTVEFAAKPDLAISEKDEPTFSFSVHADVTDTTGETRTAERNVNVGYAALKAALTVDDWQTAQQPVKVAVLTQSLDDEGRAAEGVIKIHRLKQPAKVVRAPLEKSEFEPHPENPPKVDPANPNSWDLGAIAAERAFKTDGAGKAAPEFKLEPGFYRALLETQDAFGKKITAQVPFNVLNLDGQPLAVRVPCLVVAPHWELQPGAEFVALWGTGYEQGRAFIEIEHRHKMLQAFWTEPGVAQQQVKQAVTEALRGGFTLHVTMVRENRAYLTAKSIDVPWTNKDLTVKWEHFTSKLEPGKPEKWTAVITGPDAKKAAAEMVAGLYDQSLDAFLPHQWQKAFDVFRTDETHLQAQFENGVSTFDHLAGSWPEHPAPDLHYRQFPEELDRPFEGDVAKSVVAYEPVAEVAPRKAKYDAPGLFSMAGITSTRMSAAKTAGNRSGPLAMSTKTADALSYSGGTNRFPTSPSTPVDAPPSAPIDLATVTARKNLSETAFFFPHLIAREDGSVAMEFTMPEAVTTWRFMGFAHDRDLRGGYLEDKVVTAKDIMVQPNPPRFLREGDALEFTVKVSNQSATRQTGKLRLTFADARTGQPADHRLANAVTDQAFDLPAHESRSLSWKLTVADGAEPLSYKAVGSTSRLSDGEEGLLPVLSRRTLVTESLPLPIRGVQTKSVDFTRLLASGKSDTLKSQNLTVQMVSNPSWYAVMALPYLMEFPHECSEQTFNRFYANALARHIAGSDPKIRAVFEQWKNTPALDSPLEKNADLKAVMLEETPWVREAQAESQSRRNLGILFDQNRLNSETDRLLGKLGEQQLGDGAWPWFPGGRGNDYITLYITTGFGRLRHLGAKIDTAPALKSLDRLDGWIDREYRTIKPKDRPANHLSSTIALYLYGRSFFLAEKPIPAVAREAVEYYLAQARKHWLALGERQSQAHLALALKRFGDKPAALAIVQSLHERSVNKEELGMFWRDTEHSSSWQHAPIETQALMIEAFDEVAADPKAVEDCKVWLLKQKQTQDWKTTKATADAVYALLLRGGNILSSDALVEVTLGGEPIKPEKIEAGTGFFEQKFVRGEIKPELGKITLKKTDKGVAWGSVHWQYLEDMSKVTAYDPSTAGLKITKQLFTRQLTDKGPVLEPVKGKVKVGDELVVRLVLNVDRDLEFVHLKDQRGSGTEPVNVLSQYKWQDGLGYYETTRDTATHYFFDALPKGNYVFESTTRIVHRGRYQTGFADLQCMYAPEFGAHSESLWVEAE